MLAIKNNLMAESAARHLGKSYDALARSVERLSSGLRINSAKDDAAGLAVRELMRADIAVIKQGPEMRWTPSACSRRWKELWARLTPSLSV